MTINRLKRTVLFLSKSQVALVAVIGWASCYAWLFFYLFHTIDGLVKPSYDDINVWVYRCLALLIISVAKLVQYFVVPADSSKMTIAFAGVISVSLILCRYLIGQAPVNVVLVSIGSAMVLFMWRSIGNIKFEHGHLVSRVVLLGSLIWLVVYLEPPVAELILLLLPVISVVLFVAITFCFKGSFKDDPSSMTENVCSVSGALGTLQLVGWKLDCYMVLLNSFLGIVLYFLATSLALNNIVFSCIGVSLIISAGITALIRSFNIIIDERIGLMLSLAVILPTLLIIPFMNSILLTIAMPVLFVLLIVLHGAASNCYSLSSASGGIQSSSQKNDGGFIGLSFGLLIGYLSQSWASGSPVFFVLLYYIFLLGVVLIVNSCFKSLKQQSTQLTSELAKMDDIMHLKARRAAQRYKLSTRQFEILDLLVHGRNAAHIAEKLYISKNTARSHIYTLFKTFGVHSQQDLIDLIETSRPPMQRNKSNHQV